MASGIIPITTIMSGVDIDNKCILIENNLNSIKEGLNKAINLNEDKIFNMRKNCINYINDLRIISNEIENDIIRNM